LWTVEVDRGQIRQVLLNLLVNAWQSMPGGGDLVLTTANVRFGDRDDRPREIVPGPYARITVEDTGTGMEESVLDRVFEPFFTTKGMGRGTGLGLASAYGIVKGHRGFIYASSPAGQGSVFTVYLPATAKKAGREVPHPRTPVIGSGTVLVVDDEAQVLEVVRPMLEMLGYRALSAESGERALEICREKGRGIDLVILDMIMPGMGGAETFERLRELNPQVPVLLSSGYSEHGEAGEILARGCRGFLKKPYTLQMLSEKIREALTPNGSDES
jgi:CheY-like chemotaxis protein